MILVRRVRELGQALAHGRLRSAGRDDRGDRAGDRPDAGGPDDGAGDRPDTGGRGDGGGDRPDTGGRGDGGGERPEPGGRVRQAATAVVRPFGLALFQGDADPPAATPRLTYPVPRPLGILVPFRTYNLVQAADLVLAIVLYGLTLSMVLDWNAGAARTLALHGNAPGPVSELFAYLTAIGVSLPMALRHRWPLAAWRVAIAGMPVVVWVDITLVQSDPPYPVSAILTYLMVLYSVAVRCERRISVGVWVITVLAAWMIHPNSMPLIAVIVSVAVLFGYNVRVRRTATAKLVKEEQRTRQAESAQAVLEERARIARELHDVVAHHMSVIAIQAEAVPLKAAGDPAQLEAGLAEIRGLSLEAIAELRQVLGVLRDQDGRTDTAPQPGLDRVEELIANARAAGLAVLVKRSGTLDGLPPAVELSAYRIVQESLSNAMRHAPGATVAVDVARKGGELRLRITNGPGTAPGERAGRGAGQGLVGMRERAALLGGTLDAGPLASGGFEVRATLPIAERESA
ncbi:sensor histidine kinase [Nonomuraea sp. MTCD27]|uniref:sensor histidine kinase n=1 Tax=Nonomuraea sp. MTCD27 TaxID=1676747 RepID=UPI0035BF6951